MEKNVAGKWVVFAYGLPDNATPGEAITGDAANITANIRIDGGAANAVDDTNPTELEDGYYIFDITATESNGENLLLAPASSTADVQVIGVPGAVWTRPPNFSEFGIESDGDVTQVNNSVANTDMRGTDSALLAASVNVAAGIIESNLKEWDGETLGSGVGPIEELGISDRGVLQASTTTTAQIRAAAPSFADNDIIGSMIYFPSATLGFGQARFITGWDNGTLTATFDTLNSALTGTRRYVIFGTPPADATNIADVNVEKWNGTAVPAEDTAGYPIVTLKDGTGQGEILTTSGAVNNVTLVATTTTNTDMRGTDSALLAASINLTGGAVDTVTTVTTVTTCTTNTDMRGTDSANTVVPDAAGTAPTLAEMQTTALTESYAANGAAPTQNQLLYAVHQMLMEFAISGTSYTVKKLDSSTTAFVVTLDDATNPTSNTR